MGRTGHWGVWQQDPQGEMLPAQEGERFISFHCSPRANSGVRGETVFVIWTPFHRWSNLHSPPASLPVAGASLLEPVRKHG